MPSDPLLHLVAWASIAMLILILALLIQIARLRSGLIKRMAREQRFLKEWRPLMVAAVAGDKAPLPALAHGDEIFFLKLWNHLQESLRGKAKTRLNVLALRCGVMPHVHMLLHRKELRSQLLALTTLGHLGNRNDWGDILHLARQPDPLLSFAAARALFQIDADAALHDLKPQLLERENWPPAQLATLLQEHGSASLFSALTNTAVQLANSAAPAAPAQLDRLLQLLEVAPYPLVITAVRSIIAVTADDEVIARCLKFLQEPGDLPHVRRLVAHPNWVVRLQAARVLGRCGTADDISRLATLLSDPVWWVRYRTAQALVAATHGDAQTLSELRARLSDRYARDMLEMAMTEKAGS